MLRLYLYPLSLPFCGAFLTSLDMPWLAAGFLALVVCTLGLVLSEGIAKKLEKKQYLEP